MNSVAPTFLVIGFLLMAAEIVVPGGILGTLGAIAFLIASVDIWSHYGSLWGLSAVVGSMCVGIILFFVEVRMMRKGPLARWFYLSQTTPPTSSQSAGGLPLGTKGTTLTRLNPTGLVMVNGKRLEAISRDGLIEENTDIVIVNDDPFRVAVKRAVAVD
jgi:membrane-bound serine protease (ClpP class)